jgi:hypothetical protein
LDLKEGKERNDGDPNIALGVNRCSVTMKQLGSGVCANPTSFLKRSEPHLEKWEVEVEGKIGMLTSLRGSRGTS